MAKGIHKVSISTYTEQKIKMLRKDFHIRLTKTEMRHMQALTTETSVDNYARTLILTKL